MIIVRKRKDLESHLKKKRIKNYIGFVPTMGSIHLGHLSLIKQSKKNKCITCSSIFINPSQFNNLMDFKSYPKNEKKDLELLKKNGCDIVFIPTIKEVYQNTIKINKKVKKYRNILCDNHRPSHFDGVTTVVNILLKLINPDFVFFGEKDYQQLKILEELVKVERISTKVISCPSIRDKNGMSLSSRYRLFNKNQKTKFCKISQSIFNSLNEIKNGKKIKEVIPACIKNLKLNGVTNIDYIEVRESKTMRLTRMTKNSRLFIALYLDNIRIVDNFVLQ
tara:strand:- start:112 stop:945 length:834 start_codon:yes stop_codon:yes gene_type:complete